MSEPILPVVTRYYTDPVFRAEVDADYLRRQAEVNERMDCALERFHDVPAEDRIERVMRDLGFDKLQAINHLRQRDSLAAKLRGNW